MSKEITNINYLKLYNEVVSKLRDFFEQRGFLEVPTQTNLAILAACENPKSIVKFDFDNNVWPLPQTGQMVLEEVLLENPEIPGCFCLSTSYRDEKNPIPGRHRKIFNMFEFESRGNMEDMLKLESDLLQHLGFDFPVEANYEDLCQEYGGVSILEDEHETKMWKEKGTVLSLRNFPLRTNPFFNMKKNDCTGLFNKVDVILYGQETIGSAERSSDTETMRHMFYNIEDGEYSNKLFELFGKERVEEELDKFLSYKFFPRFGGGIGMSRLLRAYELMKQEREELEEA